MNGELVITGGSVLLPDGSLKELDVRLVDGRIAEIGADLQADQRIDAAGAYVLPGLIDLHMHGIGRESLEASTLGDFARLEAEHGATTFFPAFFGPPEVTAGLMVRHRQDTDELRTVPQVGGFRLESPYLAVTGAGVSDDLAPISADTTRMLLEAGGGHIKLWDISPELYDAPEAIGYLSRRGVVCSIAHTHGTIEQARAAVDAGAKLVTHLYNTFVQPGPREPGVHVASLVEYLLIEDRLACEIILDGTHVDPIQVEVALRCKSPNRLVFITDSNFGAGLPPGRYATPHWGEIVVDGPNHGVRMADRGMALAGSALTPMDAFRNAIRLLDTDLATASRLCSTTPARVMGLNKGEIAEGRDADLILLTPDLDLLYTIAGGEVVYRR